MSCVMASCGACGRALSSLLTAQRRLPRFISCATGKTIQVPMPTAPHIERHFLSSAIVRDIVIGMADGLTVPFALAAGLSGAVSSAAIIVTAGLAEIAAGAIAMGLGGYLAARTDLEHYESELRREIDEIVQVPETERSEV